MSKLAKSPFSDGRRRPVWGRRVERFGKSLSVLSKVSLFIFIPILALRSLSVSSFLEGMMWGLAGIVCVLMLVALMFGGEQLRKKGKRHQTLSAAEAMARDSRAPIIYFRSFADEHQTRRLVTSTPSSQYYNFSRTEEEYLRAEIMKAGPFVALGKPTDALPPLGADRLYASDLEWQFAVEQILGVATAAVVRLAVGGALSWEIQQTVSKLPPDRILFVVPLGGYGYARIKAAVDPQLPRPLPWYPHVDRPQAWLNRVPGHGRFSLLGFIYFDRNWVWPVRTLRIQGTRSI